MAAVGVRHGKHLLGTRAFLDAGWKVVAFDLGEIDEEPPGEEQQAQIDDMRARWPDRFVLVDQLGGERIADALASSAEGADEVLAVTDAQLGTVEVVYLGQWWGVADYRVAEDFIAFARGTGRRRVDRHRRRLGVRRPCSQMGFALGVAAIGDTGVVLGHARANRGLRILDRRNRPAGERTREMFSGSRVDGAAVAGETQFSGARIRIRAGSA